jgi:hypothetical protein
MTYLSVFLQYDLTKRKKKQPRIILSILKTLSMNHFVNWYIFPPINANIHMKSFERTNEMEVSA